jgi:mannose-6-phosphate isomerase|tara:strand:- start:586 stop:924 length:339 start_codon:yes stop_codon:yes gene_type:complete
MRIVDKPWGHETIWAETDKYAGKLLTINPGHKLSRQYHEVKEETIYVLAGRLVLETGHDPHQTLILEPGSAYHVKPGHIHRFAAPSEGCTLIEVSTPELEDVVRLEDEYDRS